MSRRRQAEKPTQSLLPFRAGHGGARPGAGRKARPDSGVRHRLRALLSSRHPVHVTIKLRSSLPRLRQKAEYAALRRAFAAGCRGPIRAAGAFRLCQYSVLDNHLHFLVEAQDRRTLSRGLQGLLIRSAKALNKLWQRRGGVFADRYHARILTTPRDVRNVLRYVFGNARKHAIAGGVAPHSTAIDLFSSAPWFDGFREQLTIRNLPPVRPVAEASTWLLRLGWRRHGLLSVFDIPATA